MTGIRLALSSNKKGLNMSRLVVDYDPTLFKAKREMLGLNQTEFAEKCGLSQPTISVIESGKYTKPRGIHTLLLVGLVLDALADEQGKMEDIYQIELASQKNG